MNTRIEKTKHISANVGHTRKTVTVKFLPIFIPLFLGVSDPVFSLSILCLYNSYQFVTQFIFARQLFSLKVDFRSKSRIYIFL